MLLLPAIAHADDITIEIPGFDTLVSAITNLPASIVNAFFNFIVTGLISASHELVDVTFNFIFSSPDPHLFCAPYNAVMTLLESAYSVALMVLALYFIVRSGDAEGRANAKRWLEKMFVLIIVLSFSFQLFQAMLDFNNYLSTSLANRSMENMFSSPGGFASAILALVLLFPMLSFMMLTMITLLTRYLMIPFMLLLFPVAIFLYFIPFTESWGKTFLKIIAMIVFMTTIDALVLIGLNTLYSTSDPNLAIPLISTLATLYGFGMLGIVNLVVFIMAILSVISQSKAAITVIGLGVAAKAAKVLL